MKSELKDYKVEILETLTKVVPVKAKNPADAIATVKDLYMSEVIVLVADDLLSTDFTIAE